MPLNRRLPKRGFNNARFATVFETVNLDTINDVYSAGEVVNFESLCEKGLAKGNKDGIKILGNGEISKKLKFEVDKMSGSAKEKAEAAGCEVTILG